MKITVASFTICLFLITTLTFAQDFSSLQYRTVGPERGGRVTTVTGVPSLPNTFYLGATGGGVWKTEDYGTTWNNISDGFFETPSIGAIEVSVENPNVIYVGTGSDGLRSNVIAGNGVYKSVDSGATWKHIGLRDVGQIGAVEIDPKDDNVVWVAAIGNAFKSNEERGIYKTTNGGNTWEKVLYISDTVGFSDLEFIPKKPDVVYAAAWKAQRTPWNIISGGETNEGGIYKSKNGGKDWEKLNNGLPKGLIGKIDLAVSPTDKDILYAVIEAPGEEGGLYKSEDQGKSFIQLSSDKGLVNRPFYYTNIELDPTNPNIVYSNSNPLLKSVDGGKTWKRMSVPHGDNHDIWLNPNNPQLLIQCNDGGANVSHNGGKTWSSQFNQPTAELYQVEVDDQYPYWLYAGQQDNSTTIAVPSFPPSGVQDTNAGWLINTGGCETGPAVPKPGNHNVVYANCKGRFGVFDKRTGTEKSYYVGASNIYGHNPKDLKYRFQRVAPIHVSPHNPSVVYHGSQYLHKTVNDGLTWNTISPDLTAFEADKQQISGTPITRDITGEEYYSTLYSIRESSLLQGVIWTGSNDGVVSVTRDDGATWENVTPENMPKGGRVESIEPSQFDAAKAYIAVDRHLLGDTKPYLYVTNDFGNSWELLSDGKNGIPSNFVTRVLREDPVREGLLYVGTESGVFISLNDGATWQKFQQNLPVTPITDLKIFRGDLILSTMGRGFWILDNITSLRQAEILNLDKDVVLFKPDTTIRYRYPSARGVDYEKYPQTSVIIDYFIPTTYKGSIQLEILDENRNLITTILSDSTALKIAAIATETTEESKEEREIEEQEGVAEVKEVEDMNLSQLFRYTDNKLISKPGMQRFNWDLKEKGAWASELKKRYRNGPMVTPGNYIVRLTAAGKATEQSFEILMDPRNEILGVTAADLKEQQIMQRKVIDLLSEARQLQANLEQQATLLKDGSNESKLKQIKANLQLLKNAEGAYPQQMYIAQVQYLLYMISGADQLPGDEAKARFDDLTQQLETFKN
ncbi:hypothetical protein ULMS_19690 [Patiriisocius marinistellae]|uniref:Uncharacterized protein n=1 Tax=Patiriisocius marinistellae TaxID=2494560 RepID=A0A5J4G2M8_9FLAO|nr:hypothetical protein [Patiriisocius marinistellae]GEQ86461.1 hypothetical protein ULMS_19690 [Patiriisocius marinistellae]